MCKQYIYTYTCPGSCQNNLIVWDTHCDYTGRDNYRGQCGHKDFAGFIPMPYPCTTCRGLSNPATAPALIASDRAANPWRRATPSDQNHLRHAWTRNEVQYERDLTMPENLQDMTRAQWREYYNDICSMHNASLRNGAWYAEDPEPWGDNRPGGRLP
jgi:hypothetical protein